MNSILRTLAATVLAACAFTTVALAEDPTAAPAAAAVPKSLYDIPLKDIHGKDTSLEQYKGKVLLIVNVASKCGNTKQYAALEELQKKYADKGFTVLGFPSNQFGKQEPGTAEQILEFCEKTYQVTFPLFEKGDVNGETAQPLYKYLTAETAPFPGKIDWNFAKFLVGKDGTIVARYKAKAWPTDAEPDIEAALAKG
jgi:glutathione peroxidase